jgi:hypothetical protein
VIIVSIWGAGFFRLAQLCFLGQPDDFENDFESDHDL